MGRAGRCLQLVSVHGVCVCVCVHAQMLPLHPHRCTHSQTCSPTGTRGHLPSITEEQWFPPCCTCRDDSNDDQSHPRVSDSADLEWGPDFAFLTRSQVLLLRLVRAPPESTASENRHCEEMNQLPQYFLQGGNHSTEKQSLYFAVMTLNMGLMVGMTVCLLVHGISIRSAVSLGGGHTPLLPALPRLRGRPSPGRLGCARV